MIKFLIDITKIKLKVLTNKEIDESDKYVQFIANFLSKYSEMKFQALEEKFDYMLNIQPISNNNDAQTNPTYTTLGELDGINVRTFFLQSLDQQSQQSQQNQETKSEDVVSSTTESYVDTDSDYFFEEETLQLTKDVNEKMAVALIGVNRSIKDKGIEIRNDIIEHIVFTDQDNDIVDEYKQKVRSIVESPLDEEKEEIPNLTSIDIAICNTALDTIPNIVQNNIINETLLAVPKSVNIDIPLLELQQIT